MKGNIPFYRLLIQPFAELDRITEVAEYRTTARVKPEVYLFEFGRTSLGGVRVETVMQSHLPVTKPCASTPDSAVPMPPAPEVTTVKSIGKNIKKGLSFILGQPLHVFFRHDCRLISRILG